MKTMLKRLVLLVIAIALAYLMTLGIVYIGKAAAPVQAQETSPTSVPSDLGWDVVGVSQFGLWQVITYERLISAGMQLHTACEMVVWRSMVNGGQEPKIIMSCGR